MTEPIPRINNPFLRPYKTPFGVPPFEEIHAEHYMPAFLEGIRQHEDEIDRIIQCPEAPSFENTIEALENSGMLLDKVSYVFHNLHSSNTSDELEIIAEEITPLLSEHSDNITLNAALFCRIKRVFDQQAHIPDDNGQDLDQEQLRLLDETYKSFARNGAVLLEDEQERLREINGKLSLLILQFEQNLLAENNTFHLIIEDPAQLSGLPESISDAAAETARASGHQEKWMFTLHAPSLFPFLQYADDRLLRKKMLEAYLNRGNHNDKRDNKKIICAILNLRAEKARLLGYESHAAYVLEETMAKTPGAVMQLLDRLWPVALDNANKEAAELDVLMRKLYAREEQKKDAPRQPEIPSLEAADWRYYAEKLRKQKYDLDDEQLRTFFPLEQVVAQGIFGMAKALYGLKFVERNDLPKYHPEVVSYQVLDQDGSPLGVLYMDYHPRSGKHNGAWMSEFRAQSYQNDRRVDPIVTLVCNFSRPTEKTPALLTPEEVSTLFHEFGHALHGLLSNVRYRSISGTSVPRDFVELPSQFHENLAFEPEVLALFAHHYQTGASIPQDLLEKLKKSSTFNQGFETVEYLAACYLDMAYHTLPEAGSIEVSHFELEAMKSIGLIPLIPPRYRTTYFAHIFSHSYSAGYYSYIWSAMLDADAVAAFKETGSVLNREKASTFRKNILEKGHTDDPMVMYERFRGAKPSIEPLLKRKGLT